MLSQKEQRLPRYVLLALNVAAMVDPEVFGFEFKLSSIGTIGFALHALTEWHFVSTLLGSNFFTMSLFLLLAVGILSFTTVPMGLYSLMIQHSSMLVLVWMPFLYRRVPVHGLCVRNWMPECRRWLPRICS